MHNASLGPRKKVARRVNALFDSSLTDPVFGYRPRPSPYAAMHLFPHSYAAALDSQFRTRAAIATGRPPPARSFTVFIRSGSAKNIFHAEGFDRTGLVLHL